MVTTQKSRIEEVEEIPKFAKVVLNGGSGGHHPKISLQCHGYLTAFGATILDRLGFIQYYGKVSPDIKE